MSSAPPRGSCRTSPAMPSAAPSPSRRSAPSAARHQRRRGGGDGLQVPGLVELCRCGGGTCDPHRGGCRVHTPWAPPARDVHPQHRLPSISGVLGTERKTIPRKARAPYRTGNASATGTGLRRGPKTRLSSMFWRASPDVQRPREAVGGLAGGQTVVWGPRQACWAVAVGQTPKGALAWGPGAERGSEMQREP